MGSYPHIHRLVHPLPGPYPLLPPPDLDKEGRVDNQRDTPPNTRLTVQPIRATSSLPVRVGLLQLRRPRHGVVFNLYTYLHRFPTLPRASLRCTVALLKSALPSVLLLRIAPLRSAPRYAQEAARRHAFLPAKHDAMNSASVAPRTTTSAPSGSRRATKDSAQQAHADCYPHNPHEGGQPHHAPSHHIEVICHRFILLQTLIAGGLRGAPNTAIGDTCRSGGCRSLALGQLLWEAGPLTGAKAPTPARCRSRLRTWRRAARPTRPACTCDGALR